MAWFDNIRLSFDVLKLWKRIKALRGTSASTGEGRAMQIKGWRSLAAFGGMAVAYLLAWPELTTYVNPKWVAIGTTVVGIFLRFITSSPVGKTE